MDIVLLACNNIKNDRHRPVMSQSLAGEYFEERI
jgi:hypothetical protein